MSLLKNIGYLATCIDEGDQSNIHHIRDAAIVWEDSEILWIGKENELPAE